MAFMQISGGSGGSSVGDNGERGMQKHQLIE